MSQLTCGCERRPNNLLMNLKGRSDAVRFLLRDRAGQLTTAFDHLVAAARDRHREDPPPRRPRANCFVERFVLTVTQLTGPSGSSASGTCKRVSAKNRVTPLISAFHG